MELCLEGIRILDLSRYLPGPYATQLLADFGAEVIKIEEPKVGELGRHLAPMINDESSRFYTVNRNKKSVTINLKKEDGKEVFKKLVKTADIVVDQFRPGVMDKLGLGYEVLKNINEKIIYCALTGYGLDGPLRDEAGHDLNYLSLAGITEQLGSKDQKPVLSGVQIADTAGGSLYAVIGILLALNNREKTGKGQLCDVAMLDGAISLLSYGLGEWAGNMSLPKRGNETLTGGYACYQIYETKDNKYVSLGAVEDKFWIAFCQRIKREEYITTQWEIDKQVSMIEDISNILMRENRDEWVSYFKESNICFTPVLNMEEMCKHPQVESRQMVTTIKNFKGSGKDMHLTGLPIKFSEKMGEVKHTFSEVGQDNKELLKTIGYSKDEIDRFIKEGIL